MFYRNRLKSAAIAGAMTLLTSTSVLAQDAARGVLEEIVVTAEKREANVQDVAIPVTVIDATSLLKSNFTDLVDLGNMVPGLSIGGSGTQEMQIALRGLAPPNAGIGMDEPVALYVDDVYIGRSSNNFRNAMLGIERIEVLRGPQGTLYGRNAVGGAIVVTTKRPTEDTDVQVRGRIGNYDSLTLDALISGEVAENVFGLITARSDQRNEGYQYNLADGRWSGGLKNETAVRAVVRFTPTDSLDISLIGDFTRYKGSGNGPARNILAYDTIPGTTTDDRDPTDENWDQFYSWPSGDPAQNDLSSDRISETLDYFAANGFSPTLLHTATGAESESKGFAATIDYELDNALIESITSFRSTEIESTIDSYSRRHPAVANMGLQKSDQVSQEIRISSTGDRRLNWLAGVAYFNEDVDNLNIFRRVYCVDALGSLGGPYDGAAGCRDGNAEWATDLPYNTARIRRPRIEIDSWAAFGQIDYDFTDALTGILGLRYADEEKTWNLDFKNFTTPLDQMAVLGASDSWSKVSPKIGLQYRPSDDTMYYGTVAQGFKSGGFDARSTAVGGDSVEPETSVQYEVGVKTQFAENRWRANAAVYFNDYTDLQLRVFCPPTDPVCGGSTALINASAAEITGAEIEFSGLLTDNFVISGFVNYMDAVFTDYKPNATTDFTGNKLPRAPEWQYSIVGDYTIDLQSGNVITVNGTWRWSDSEFFRADNTPLDENKSNGYLSARIGYENLDSGWSLALFANNLTDEIYRNNGFAIGTATTAAFYNMPRMYGLEFMWRSK